ncbi:hypothetical protein [Streptomyces sp. NRRL S-337]|uniref:hypothetical protein n=1 Tax=Streptomyces sp. NRRL S-337 TaxID=1463900 RepID=UPI0004C85FC2|nr:hypothetical protein [Streptomyces sp. NRRL S-337]
MSNYTNARQGSHQWIMTVEMPGQAMQTLYGTCTPGAGATRHDVFLDIKAGIAEESPQWAHANVVFFSFERNTL